MVCKIKSIHLSNITQAQSYEKKGELTLTAVMELVMFSLSQAVLSKASRLHHMLNKSLIVFSI